MDTNRETELEQRTALVDLLSSLFLALPDEMLLESLLTLEWGESDSAGSNEIAAYIDERRDIDHKELLLELGRDRARLIRGANNDGMRSAYESLYDVGTANESIGSLNRFYADAGFMLVDDVHDTVDQIGVEMAFCSMLMKRELESLRQNDEAKADEWYELRERFMGQHLGRWIHEYAADMHKFALTGFYRGVALLIEEAF